MEIQDVSFNALKEQYLVWWHTIKEINLACDKRMTHHSQ